MRSHTLSNPAFLALLGSASGGGEVPPSTGPAAPAPLPAWFTETPLVSSKRQVSVPGLSGQELVTVFIVLNKARLVEDLRMAFSILTANSYTRTWVGFTGTSYSYDLGVTYNTFIDGFVHIVDTSVLDNEQTILLSAVLGRAGVTFYLNGVLVEIKSIRNAQLRLEWSDEFVVGGETNQAYDWQGIIYAFYLYFGELSEADRKQTEAYLRARFPQVN